MRLFHGVAAVSLLSSIAWVLLVLTELAAAQDRGLDLLHRLQKAVGGPRKISAIHDYEEMVIAETFSASGESRGEVRKRVRWVAPNYLRIDQVGSGSTYVLFFDGTSRWEILPDRESRDKTNGVPIDLADSELKFARGYSSTMIFKLWLADRMRGYSVSSPRENVVRVVSDAGNGFDITLDAKTWLPVKDSTTQVQPDQQAPQEIRYEEWTMTNGIRFPAVRANFHDGIRLAVLHTKKVQVNRGLKVNDLKAKPPDSQPDPGN
jgi:hypothetical protein